MKRFLTVLAIASVLVLAMAAPAMAFSTIDMGSSCFTTGCHTHVGYTTFAMWHSSHQAYPCASCHTTVPAMKTTALACDGCHPGEVAAHFNRGVDCTPCHAAPTTTTTSTTTTTTTSTTATSTTTTSVTVPPTTTTTLVPPTTTTTLVPPTTTTTLVPPTTTYTLNYSAGANGTISGTSPQTVSSGGSGTAVTAVASAGYHFTSWSDGVLTAARTDTNVVANKGVTANFAINSPTPSLMPVWRFYNMRTGTHFYTASATEMANVRDTLYRTYRLEGVAYYVNTANPANNTPLYRFFNVKNGVHFYTAGEAEKANVLATLPQFRLEGVAYYVSLASSGGAAPVYRFFNFKKGAHFYTAGEAEMANVRDTLYRTYRLEGVGFYLAP